MLFKICILFIIFFIRFVRSGDRYLEAKAANGKLAATGALTATSITKRFSLFIYKTRHIYIYNTHKYIYNTCIIKTYTYIYKYLIPNKHIQYTYIQYEYICIYT